MHSKTLLAGLAVLSLVGCGGSAKVSLSARAGAKPTPAPVAPIASSAQPLALASGIELDRVRFAIRRLKLETTATTTTSTSGESGESSANEVSVGPFIVDLQGAALNGGVQQVFDAEVPVGTYREVKFEIHRLDETSGVADPVWKTASILIDGKVDGSPFTFSSGLDEEQEREARIAVEAGQNNITLNVDPANWFVSTSDGGRLDPRDSSSRSQIESNIKSSIDTMEDDDEDGHEDAEDGSESGADR